MIEIIKKNLAEIHQRIADAASKSESKPEQVKLVAVTKYFDARVTRAVVDAGCHRLGENRPQQLWDKAESLKELEIAWHMIGHLQRNKVKRTVDVASLIHSVDSIKLLKSIDSASSEIQKTSEVLIEINVSGEEAKHGLEPHQLSEFLTQAAELSAVKICGLMCMAGLNSDDQQTKNEFDLLRKLRDDNRKFDGGNIELSELSMGMSGDFETAIEHGATIVRVGSAIFEGIEQV